MPSQKCPVCEEELKTPPDVGDYGNRQSITCPRCGKFRVAGVELLTKLLRNLSGDDRTKLSALIRTGYQGDFEITPENFNGVSQRISNYNYTVSEKQLLLLRHLERLTNHPGDHVQLDLGNDYPVIWAHSFHELKYHLVELARRRLIEEHSPLEPAMADREFTMAQTISITTKGWDFLDDNPKLTSVGNQAFVAMSFSESMKSVFSEGIKPALANAGYRAYRVDFDEHIQRIDAKIEHEIRNSAFVVADVTEQKQGVYYEAGFAKALGLPVIWSVKEDEIEKVHFDTRQYYHIMWRDEAQLRTDLYHLISAVIGIRR